MMAGRPDDRYGGVMAIEEPLIKVVENALQSRALTPLQMLQAARTLTADFGYSMTWSHILTPYVQRGVPEDPDGIDRWKAICDVFYESFPTEFAAFTRSFDDEPTKFLHAHAIFVDHTDPLFWMVSGDVRVCRLVEAGNFAFYTGAPGYGKSEYAFRTVEDLVDLWENHLELGKKSRLSKIVRSLGARDALDPTVESAPRPDDLPQNLRLGMAGAKEFRVLTNTQFGSGHRCSKYMRLTPALSDFLIESDQALLDGAYQLHVMDEYGAATKRGVQNRNKRMLELYARRVRKKNASILYVSQDEGDLTPWIVKWLNTRVQMLADREMLLTVVGTPYNFRRVLGVWPTSIPYNTGSRSPVIDDIDLEEYEAFMGELEKSLGFDDPAAVRRQACVESMKWVRDHRESDARAQAERAKRHRSKESDDEDS